jgi:hypothetical protein
MRRYGALVGGLLMAATGGADAAQDGKFSATTTATLGIVLIKPEAVAAQSGFDVQMQAAGDYALGAATKCLSAGTSGSPVNPAASARPNQGSGETVLVQARYLGPCNGGQTYRLIFMSSDPAGQTSPGALLLRPE